MRDAYLFCVGRLGRLPSEVLGDVSYREFVAGLAADRVIRERENAWFCEKCMKKLQEQQTCALCDCDWHEPGEQSAEDELQHAMAVIRQHKAQ